MHEQTRTEAIEGAIADPKFTPATIEFFKTHEAIYQEMSRCTEGMVDGFIRGVEYVLDQIALERSADDSTSDTAIARVRSRARR